MKRILLISILIITSLNRSEAAQPAKIYAVVIGECHYKETALNKLKYCESDAAAFTSFLKSPQAGAIPAENIISLEGTRATRSAILNAVSELYTARATENDMIIFYFSGHGASRASGGYLMPYDAQDADPISTGVAMDQLYAIIKASPAKMKAVYIDACHAGQYPHDPRAKGSESGMNQAINQAFVSIIDNSKPGMLNVLSSKGDEESQESETLQGGLFTHYLIKGLKGDADKSPSDGHVTTSELDDYLSQKVADASHFRQHPVITRTIDADFPLSIIDLSLTLSEMIGRQKTIAMVPTTTATTAPVTTTIKPPNQPLTKGMYYDNRTIYATATFINKLGFPITMDMVQDENGRHDQGNLVSEDDQFTTGKLCIKRFTDLEQAQDQYYDCIFYIKAEVNGVTKYAILRKTIQSCYNQYFVLTPRNIQFTTQRY